MAKDASRMVQMARTSKAKDEGIHGRRKRKESQDAKSARTVEVRWKLVKTRARLWRSGTLDSNSIFLGQGPQTLPDQFGKRPRASLFSEQCGQFVVVFGEPDADGRGGLLFNHVQHCTHTVKPCQYIFIIPPNQPVTFVMHRFSTGGTVVTLLRLGSCETLSDV